MDVNAIQAAWAATCQQRAQGQQRGLTILLSLAALPSLVASAWLGHGWVRALPSADPGFAGMVLGALVGGLGLLSGLWDGTCALRFEAFRVYLIQPRALYLAELAVGLWTPVKRFWWALGTAFCLSAAWTRPILLPWLLLALSALMLSVLVLERLVGVFSRLFGSSLKSMVIFAGLFLAMRSFLAVLMAGGNLRGVPNGQHLLPLVSSPAALASFVPTTWLVAALRVALRRGWPSSEFLAFVGAVAGIVALTFCLLRSDLQGLRAGTAGPTPRLWRFDRPWVGVAMQHLHRIWTSKMGRFLLFLPILALTSLIDPLVFGFRPGSTWILAWAGLMMVPLGRKLASNLFGLDRGGVRGFWTLPLEDRDLLLGKLVATALYQGLIVALLMTCLAFASPIRPQEIPGGIFLCISLCLFHLRVGLRRSLVVPLPLDPESLNPAELDDPTLVTLGQLLLPWVLLVTAWGLTIRVGPGWSLGTMFGTSVLAGWLLLRSIPKAVSLLAERRESLTLLLEGAKAAD